MDDARSRIEGDAEVVNDELAAPEDRLAAGVGNRTDVGLSLRRDTGDDGLSILNDRLAVRDDKSAIDNDESAAEIVKRTDVDNGSDA